MHIFVKGGSIYSTSNQDKNDHRPILYTSSITFHQQKCIVFMCVCVCVCVCVPILPVIDATCNPPR